MCDYVLHAVADDYESLETMMDLIKLLAAQDSVSVTRDDVLSGLQTLTANGHIQAFLLFERPPYCEPSEYSRERAEELWFKVTAKGKKLLDSDEIKQRPLS